MEEDQREQNAGGAAEAQETRADPPAQQTAAAETPSTAPAAPPGDPFWSRDSLKLDPPPLRGGKGGELDWKLWPALITPKLAAATTLEQIDKLFEHNHVNLQHYSESQGERREADLVFEFDLARNRVKKAC